LRIIFKDRRVKMNKFEILFGYDDPRMLEAVSWAMGREGHNITRVSSTNAVLETLRQKAFDLVILDFNFKKTDDIYVLHKVKEFYPKTIVVMLCFKNDITYYDDAFRVEADDYIFKPCSKTKLWERVSNYIESMELNRISNSAELNDNVLNKHVLNIVKSTLEEVKFPLGLLEELLELVNLGAYGEIDEKVRTKLNEAYKIATRLNRTVEGQLGNVYKSLYHFHITQKIPEWKKDIVNPVLGNIY
jgi:PleD family two-component response regulator